ncbi:MAG: TlpA disulfide reductase family protein [Acidaminobacteraceae bacterium]
MKKIWILLLMLTLVGLGGCSKAEDVELEALDKENAEKKIVTSEVLDEDVLDEAYFVKEDRILEINKLAPNFSLENLDLDGGNITLEDYKGKYVLINFWATWCGYCKDEMPNLQAFADENSSLEIIAVNVEESRDLVEKYIKEGGYTFDVALDSDGDLSRAYYISSFPTSIFLDRYGNLIGGVQGLMSKEDMGRIFEYVKEQEEILSNK